MSMHLNTSSRLFTRPIELSLIPYTPWASCCTLLYVEYLRRSWVVGLNRTNGVVVLDERTNAIRCPRWRLSRVFESFLFTPEHDLAVCHATTERCAREWRSFALTVFVKLVHVE